MARIAFLSPSADRKNGWGEVTYELIMALKEVYGRSLEIDVYLPKGEQTRAYYAALPFVQDVFCVLPPFAYSFRHPIRLWQYLCAPRLQREVDMIHALDFPYAVAARRMSQKTDIPYLITLCGTFHLPRHQFPDRWIFETTYANAGHVSAISAFTLAAPRAAFHLAPEKTSIIHAGVNYNRFATSGDTGGIKERYGKDVQMILGIGALKARKGFDLVIRAMTDVRRECPNAVYVIVGAGSMEPALRMLVHELHLEQVVFFETAVDDTTLPSFLQACDIYCHTPRVVEGAFEGFGIVYLQAGAAGKPVVASRSGGVPDAVRDKETGLLVEEEQPQAIAAALIELLRDPTRRATLGQANARYARSHDWTKIATQYMAQYTRLGLVDGAKVK